MLRLRERVMGRATSEEPAVELGDSCACNVAHLPEGGGNPASATSKEGSKRS